MARRSKTRSLKCMSKDDVFYGNEWSREMEELFLSQLEDEATCGNFVWPHQCDRSLEFARFVVNTSLGMNLSSVQCTNRMHLLQFRLRVFQFLLHSDCITWNRTKNVVKAADSFWDVVTKVQPICQAYRHNGEDFYEGLILVFGVPEYERDPPISKNFVVDNICGLLYQNVVPSTPTMSVSIEEIAREEFETAIASVKSNKKPCSVPPTMHRNVPPSPTPSQGSSSVPIPKSKFVFGSCTSRRLPF